MNRKDKIELITLKEERDRRIRSRKIDTYYLDKGPLRRELYPKHLAFFAAGKNHRERLFMAANRVGKTEGAGGVELTYHLTGKYPIWWTGKRFDRPVNCWVAGDTAKTTRDIIQMKLFGPKEEMGTGLIPKDLIYDKPTAKAGVPDAFDTALIKHASGGLSRLQFKSFDQGRRAFEGTERDVIWLDEEPPLDVYTECLLRTADTTGAGLRSGIIILTFTPMLGMSETVLSFLPKGEIRNVAEGSKFVIMASWDDVPHLTEQTKKELLASIPPFQRDARSKGVPQLGSGAILPVPESDFVIKDFEIPKHFARAYGMDVGWNRTAAIWGAHDREKDILYLTGEHYRAQAEPVIHATSIKAHGIWIPGVIDPAARGRQQADGKKLMQEYIDLGLDLEIAFNGVESGLLQYWQRLSTGRLKVFRSLGNWLEEYRLYRRDEKGQVIKGFDHAMDASRYLIMSGIERARLEPNKKKGEGVEFPGGGLSGSWMG